ncbi:MAG TPA: LacI family transcriptional regulator [Clostridiaceae bacterium]|nr:LacI family transcriptional regulator [Clostridiaceae bacterium]
MSVTAKDVAKLAGVSTATVSRVINNDPRISENTRARVMKCINELNYKVNNIARSLKTNRTYTIGFIAPEISNEFFMNVARGVEDEARKYGYSIIICNSNESIEEEENRIKLLCEKCVDGIIIIPTSNEGKHFNYLKKQNIPVVLADRLVENFQSDAVLVDNINGTYSAIEYLINNGYRRIGFISGDLKLTSAIERYEGYRRALKDYCIPYDSSIVKFGDFHVECGYRLMKELYEAENTPPVVFISNYFMHIGATKYLLEVNMRRNQINYRNCNDYHNNDEENNEMRSENNEKDIMIASFDDMELSALLGFCKLRVAQPVTEIGRQAARLLLNRIEQKRQESSENSTNNTNNANNGNNATNNKLGHKDAKINNLISTLPKQKIIRLKTSLVFT